MLAGLCSSWHNQRGFLCADTEPLQRTHRAVTFTGSVKFDDSPLILFIHFPWCPGPAQDNEPVDMLVRREDGPTLRGILHMGKGQEEEWAKLSFRTNVRRTVHRVLSGKGWANSSGLNSTVFKMAQSFSFNPSMKTRRVKEDLMSVTRFAVCTLISVYFT